MRRIFRLTRNISPVTVDETWLIDTGPLVALLVGDDHQHEWALEQSRHAPATVLTRDAVISETLFLLKREGHSIDDLLHWSMQVFCAALDRDFAFYRKQWRQTLPLVTAW